MSMASSVMKFDVDSSQLVTLYFVVEKNLDIIIVQL